jgi:hypothetical protein
MASLLFGVWPQTLFALRAGPLSAGRKGGKTTKGANPLWEPLRANKQRVAAAQAKGQACLRNRSLVVPDKVPPADLYVESEPSTVGRLWLAHKHRKSKHSLGVPLVRPLEQSIWHMAKGAPKGVPPFGFPHGQTHSGLRLRGTKGRSRLRNRSLVALIKCLRRI